MTARGTAGSGESSRGLLIKRPRVAHMQPGVPKEAETLQRAAVSSVGSSREMTVPWKPVGL